MSGFMDDESCTVERVVSRRGLMQSLGTGALLAGFGMSLPASAKPNKKERNILNFALQLEYLEAEFYSYATTGQGIPTQDTTGTGTQGATTGGAPVNFTDPLTGATAVELAADELAHVRFLRTVLGNNAVAKPAINLAALGFGFGNQTDFLRAARILEDVGVSAYAGAATGFKKEPTVLMAAAQILATEAYHAGNIRFQVVDKGISPGGAIDAKDQPPTASNFFPTDANGLAIARTVAEVVALVSPFFPNGLNSPLP